MLVPIVPNQPITQPQSPLLSHVGVPSQQESDAHRKKSFKLRNVAIDKTGVIKRRNAFAAARDDDNEEETKEAGAAPSESSGLQTPSLALPDGGAFDKKVLLNFWIAIGGLPAPEEI